LANAVVANILGSITNERLNQNLDFCKRLTSNPELVNGILLNFAMKTSAKMLEKMRLKSNYPKIFQIPNKNIQIYKSYER